MIGSGFSASAGQKTAGQIEKETKEFTAEIAENAEKKNLNNLCDEILLGTTSNFMFHIVIRHFMKFHTRGFTTLTLLMLQHDARIGRFHPLGVTAYHPYGCEIPLGCAG